MSYFCAALWLGCFALCMWLERSKLACIRKHAGWSMVALFVISGLCVAPIALGQVAMHKLLARVTLKTEKL